MELIDIISSFLFEITCTKLGDKNSRKRQIVLTVVFLLIYLGMAGVFFYVAYVLKEEAARITFLGFGVTYLVVGFFALKETFKKMKRGNVKE